jgi:hypothetical protein
MIILISAVASRSLQQQASRYDREKSGGFFTTKFSMIQD